MSVPWWPKDFDLTWSTDRCTQCKLRDTDYGRVPEEGVTGRFQFAPGYRSSPSGKAVASLFVVGDILNVLAAFEGGGRRQICDPLDVLGFGVLHQFLSSRW